VLVVAVHAGVAGAQDQPPGSIRGLVTDRDFDTPIAGARATIVETGQAVATTEQGHFVLPDVPPGHYTLIFTKGGYTRQVKADVAVLAGQLTDVDVALSGEVTEMDEFVVQDVLQLGTGTEAALLGLRLQSASFMDSISSDLMSRAGAGDAASALKLVSGASVQDGKFAVIRGLPDRYVSSQLNGVRLPSADENTRAVELDQFPAAVIESIQVSKTFTPDQQGDASGGAVNVKLKSIPDENILQFSAQGSLNSNVNGSDFLSYDDGGLDFLGKQDKPPQESGTKWTGAAGVSDGDTPRDYKWSVAAGGKQDVDSGWRIGGLASLFYERDSQFHDDGIDDSYWVTHPGDAPTPQIKQGSVEDGTFKTALFDVTQAEQSVQWGGLGTLGLENEDNRLSLTYLYTHKATDLVTLAQDTRGKEYFFPGYHPNDVDDPGNQTDKANSAPYIRTETLQYTERTSSSLQLHGEHTLSPEGFGIDGFARFRRPVLDWTLSHNSANLDQPDKRQFGSYFVPHNITQGFPEFGIDPIDNPSTWFPYQPGENGTLGNFQRIFKSIEENGNQGSVDLKLPFEQWSGDEGYLKFGAFSDEVKRTFDQDTFSNFDDVAAASGFLGGVDDFWSTVFPSEGHLISAADTDVDYKGRQDISAQYGMLDLPLNSSLNIIGGARFESTEISIVNDAEAKAVWFPPGGTGEVELHPGDADVAFSQDDVLPSVGLVYRPTEQVTVRASYTETVARQTFKELSAVVQQEYLGGPIFIGNPELQMSALQNKDVRLDYVPEEGQLFSASWFTKDVDQPIENVQKVDPFAYTTAVNYPHGELSGYEFELRQSLGTVVDELDGLSVGANATFIDSRVDLPADEIADFQLPGIEVPITSRDMTNAPDHLYNLYLTYDVESTGTQFALFYTIKGDTLVAGAGQSEGNFVPSVYEKEYGTVNFSVTQELSERARLQFQIKNLTDPSIQQVYRSDFIPNDVVKTSYTRGREFTLGLSVRF